jgi:uncharacterized damage-inducible protein DinB
MTESERIADQLKRAFEGQAWHGPAVLEALSDVTAAQAAAKPIAAAHSIWELVLHMTCWMDTVRRRALGEAFMPSDEQDWPPVRDTSDAAWRAAVADMERSHRAAHDVIASFPEAGLDQPLVPGGTVAYAQFHGLVQHDLYHAGQIAVLKKGAARKPGAAPKRRAAPKKSAAGKKRVSRKRAAATRKRSARRTSATRRRRARR